MPSIFAKFRSLVSNILNDSIGSISKTIIKNIKNDEPFELQLIYSKVDDSGNQMESAIINMSDIDDKTLAKIAINNRARFRSYKSIISESGTNFSFLSDSNKKLIQKISNRELNRIMLRGGGIEDFKKALAQKITERTINIDTPNIIAEKFYDAVKVFNRDGKKRISFLNKNGKKYSFTIEHYTNIISESIFNESNWSTAIKDALKKGTGLIKFNSTGTSKSSYLKQKDVVCARIDGEVFSVHPNGSTDKSGKWYPSIFTIINNDKWLRPHPFCKHKPEVYG